MKISAVSPKIKDNSKIDFGLRTDKATQDLVLNSNVPETVKILFKNMLSDRQTDRFTITIKENAVDGYFKYIFGLKDKNFPFAKEERKGLEIFNDHIVIEGKDTLAELIQSIFYPERFDSYAKGLEFVSDTNIKPLNEAAKAKLTSTPIFLK